jgi:hypothetical protein
VIVAFENCFINCTLKNTTGVYDYLIAHMKKLEEEKFLYDTVVERMTVINEPEDLESYL